MLIASCAISPKEKEISPAFYHWKTHFSPTEIEKNYLQNFAVKKIYVKFFDVDWNGKASEPLPVAEVILDRMSWGNIEIVPTIFITNRSLKNYPLDKMEILAKHIFDKIKDLSAGHDFMKKNINEIQIDCDWSGLTKEKYFRLLYFFKKEITQARANDFGKKIKLSATIRLHQVKYFERTGVPPVDRGMLMFYNVDEVKDWETRNSILDIDVAKQYFYNFEKYPLDLDVALPIFSWGVLFRDGEMVKLMPHLRAENLADTTYFSPIFPKQLSPISASETPSSGSTTFKNKTYFEVQKSTYLDGKYLYKGDKIRLEMVTIATLKKAAQLLKSKIANSEITVSFYHLDTNTIKYYPYEKLQEVIDIF
ncbi:MAG TPA: hypothetical protein ENJ53_02160 [Phaeodactylibacter sp.]|nr:hypothetical protein [Phaeodactylibacter sp.]